MARTPHLWSTTAAGRRRPRPAALAVIALATAGVLGAGLALASGGGHPSTGKASGQLAGGSPSTRAPGANGLAAGDTAGSGPAGTAPGAATAHGTPSTAAAAPHKPAAGDPAGHPAPGASKPVPAPAGAAIPTPATPAAPAVLDGPGIWVAGTDGSQPHRLVADAEAGTGGGPSWSPDGKQVAFVGADHALYIVAADGSGRHRLAAGPVEALAAEGTSAAWGPDDTILYAAWDGKHGTVHVVGLDGSGDIVLTPKNFPRVIAVAYSPQSDAFFSDGTRLFQSFAGNCDEFGRDPAVCKNRTGTVSAQIPVGPGQLATSDDGRTQLAAGGGHITMVDDSGDDPRTFDAHGSADALAWQGHFAGYAWSVGGSTMIARSAPDDPRAPQPLVTLPHATQPAWLGNTKGGGPDASPVLFVDGDAGGGRQGLGVARADGGDRRLLLIAPTGTAVHLAAVAGGPTGKLIVFSVVAP